MYNTHYRFVQEVLPRHSDLRNTPSTPRQIINHVKFIIGVAIIHFITSILLSFPLAGLLRLIIPSISAQTTSSRWSGVITPWIDLLPDRVRNADLVDKTYYMLFCFGLGVDVFWMARNFKCFWKTGGEGEKSPTSLGIVRATFFTGIISFSTNGKCLPGCEYEQGDALRVLYKTVTCTGEEGAHDV